MTDNSKEESLPTKDLALLQALGVVGSDGAVTPEAYIGYISRLRVNEQAQALGLPLIILPPPVAKSSPEKKVATFFSKDSTLYVDAGFEESYMLKSFIGSMVPNFNVRKKKHDLSKQEIDAIASQIAVLSEGEVIRRLEENNVVFQPHFGWAYSIRMPKLALDAPYDLEKLISRFYSANCYQLDCPSVNDLPGDERRCKEYLKSRKRAKQYGELMLKYLWLWRSLPPEKWSALIMVCLQHWDKMSTGWPDINILSPKHGLVLVEVKGKDKLHTSQIYTLLKLRDVLGPSRVAIAWANRIAYDLPIANSDHQESVWKWLTTPPELRVNSIAHPEFFYDPRKSLFT
jgi:hypothetical protein